MLTANRIKLEVETDGEWITLYRKKLNLSQGEVASLCNVSVPYVSMLENDRTPLTKRIKIILEDYYHQKMNEPLHRD